MAGLQSRWLPWTPIVAFAMCAAGWRLFVRPHDACETFLRRLFIWGAYCLVLGLVLEPYEGGIKKDHPTVSYYFVTTGLAIFTLMAFTVITDWPGKKRWMRLLVNTGQNPMIAYAGITNLLPPVLGVIGLETLIQDFIKPLPSAPWFGVLYACIKMVLLALAVSFCTRRKIYWRT